MLSRCLLLQMGRVPNARICPLFSALVRIKGTQKEIGALLFEQDQRNPEQQIRVNGGLVQRNVEILLYSSNPVKHRVAMGEERVAGSFERTAAGQVVVERFAILRILFLSCAAITRISFAIKSSRPSTFFNSSGVLSWDTVQTLPL